MGGWLKRVGSWAWKNKWDIALTAVSFVPGGAVIGVLGKAAMIARVANAGRSFGSASGLTSNIAGRMYTGLGSTIYKGVRISKDGLRDYRAPALKHAGPLKGRYVSNFEKYTT